MEAEYLVESPEEMAGVAREIRERFAGQKLFVLNGDLGSGKTTFVKAFCGLLGIEEEVSSPTFAIVQEYGDEQKVYHFDLYRLKNEEELFQIGFEEYLDSEAYVFIEWPELAAAYMPERYVEIDFTHENKNQRRLQCRMINNG